MPFLTSFILTAILAYVGSWYFGFIPGNFPLLLFIVAVITGIYWVAEKIYFLPQRKKAAMLFMETSQAQQADFKNKGIETPAIETTEVQQKIMKQPWWLDWTAGLFPVILFVFLLRSFAFEPFKIPSGSMIPTLLIGDLILVNKYTYGIRLPVLNTKITQGNSPQRGDVMVFRFPPKPTEDYIKRVVGLPGDEVAYINKKLFINGEALEYKINPDFLDEKRSIYYKQFEEKLGKEYHEILNNDKSSPFVFVQNNFPQMENCQYNLEGVVCKVPAGHYFMMGDNRDDSSDSRYWGFVPEENIVGKAFFVWMNLGDWGRIGRFN